MGGEREGFGTMDDDGENGNKQNKKNQLQKTDDYSELENMGKSAEFKVFIALVQEGATFDVWRPIQLSKAIHKEIGEVRSVKVEEWIIVGGVQG